MSEPVLKIEKEGGTAVLTLNRPQAMNALSRTLRSALVAAFTDVQRDPGTRVVILTGAGRAFCAGLDLKELAGETIADAGPEAAVAEGDIIQAMAACDRPIIGAINGFAITGGFELALACDVLLASTMARFADTHARVGIMPGWGLSQKLSRMVGIGRAKEISLTGNFVSAEEALAMGLVNRVVAPDQLLPTCERIARDMLSCEPGMVSAYKRVIDEGFAGTFRDGRKLEVDASRAHAKSVTPGQVAETRRRTMARGRDQVR